MMKPTGLIGTLSSLPASATILGQVSLFFYVGDVAQWIVDHWRNVTRNAWEKFAEFANIDLTNIQKDYLTALVFFLPVFILAYLRIKKRRAPWEVVLAAVFGIIFFYLFSPQIFSDLYRLAIDGGLRFVVWYLNFFEWTILVLSFFASPFLLWLGFSITKHLFFGPVTPDSYSKPKLRVLQLTGPVCLLFGLISTVLLLAYMLNAVGVPVALGELYRPLWGYITLYLIVPLFFAMLVFGIVLLRKTKKQRTTPVDPLATPETAWFRAPPTDQERKIGNAVSAITYVLLFGFAAFPVIRDVGIFESILAILLVILLCLILIRDPRKLNHVAVLVVAMILIGILIDYVLIAVESIKGLAVT